MRIIFTLLDNFTDSLLLKFYPYMLGFFFDKKMIIQYFILFSMINTIQVCRNKDRLKLKENNKKLLIERTASNHIIIFEHKLKNKLKRIFKKEILRIFDILGKNIDEITKAKVASYVINTTVRNVDRIARDAMDELKLEYDSEN